MFKSIQWKIVTMFLLVILSVTTIIGSFLMINIVNMYNDEFSIMMDSVFTAEYVSQLEQNAAGEDGLSKISDMVRSYIGLLGIDTYRFYYILDARSGAVLATSYDASPEELKSINLEKTDNIILAMSGQPGNSVNTEKKYMDYAVCVKVNSEPAYIIYIKDTKVEIQNVTQRVLLIILQALLLSVLISVVIGYFLSRTITTPIITLTKRAERLADGRFEKIPVSKSDDEIGRLSNTFRFMSSTLHSSIEELESEKTKIETILSNMTDGILAFNVSGNIVHINPEAMHILGLDNIDSIEFDDLFEQLGADITLGDLLYITHTSPLERHIEYNERYIHLNFVATLIEDKIDGIVVVVRDITKQQKLELSRREFVANVSHELRTPLTTVKSYAETLIDSADDPSSMEVKFLKVIETETDRMTRIVKDLLTLSHLDNNTDGQIQKDDVDVQKFIESVISKIEINARNKDQTIEYTVMNQMPVLHINRDRLEQVLVNILSNAIKYTPNGGHIEVFSSRIYNNLIISVIDDGIGIPEENLPRIFERFYRVDKARSRDTGGTGLGLAIAKQIVEGFGGKIAIKSEYGKGTEVNITLPV